MIKWKDNVGGSMSSCIHNNLILAVACKPTGIDLHTEVICRIVDDETDEDILYEKIKWSAKDHYTNNMSPLDRGKQIVELNVSIMEVLTNDL